VFVVDDDQDFAESLALLVEGRDCEVELAFSGEEAIEKFREQDFDITFMDVRLPGKDGVESFLEIRKFKPLARVVMMTGYSVEQLLEQAVEHGAWGVLDKPIDVHRVLEMIDNIKPDQEAIERIRANGIDILILDLRMPILSGLETYLELKRTGHAIPTLIVTAYADEEAESIDKLRSLSVSGILRKPFDPRELLEAVERLSRMRKE
jgi:CheY-like chemotaxis protein